jgi:cAMP and cAMP-inhibited cGMP 3',5'-cyclic phosphodiesterase 10
MVSMDVLVIKIMNFAQRLVNADRASLFLIDSKSNELYATVFDLKDIQDIQENSPGANTKEIKGEEIRFKVGVGIGTYKLSLSWI